MALVESNGGAPAAANERVKGYLVVSVCEASGKNKDDIVVWDPSFVEGFVKGAWWEEREREKRRGPRAALAGGCVRAASTPLCA